MTRPLPLRRLLARWGICSRKDVDALVLARRLSVNGTPVEDPEHPIAERDVVEQDGVALAPLPALYLALNKPEGVVTTRRDPLARATVIDLLPPEWRRATPVGRLDRDSCGLLVLTSDGRFNRAIAGRGARVAKVYRVEVNGRIESAELDPLRAGAVLDGRACLPMEAGVIEHRARTTLLEIVLREGRHRQIRRLLMQLGRRVVRLERVAIGPLRLGSLAPGECRALAADEVAALVEACGRSAESRT